VSGGDLEPEERAAFHRGGAAAGRLKLYKLLKAGDKAVVETGNLAFLMAKETERAAGRRVRALSSHHLPVIYATNKKTDKEDSLKPAHLAAAEGEYITGAGAFANPNDGANLKPFLERLRMLPGHRYEKVTADAGYEREGKHAYLAGRRQRAYSKPANYERRKSRKFMEGISKRENMAYDGIRLLGIVVYPSPFFPSPVRPFYPVPSFLSIFANSA
jgi:hypothetical protein